MHLDVVGKQVQFPFLTIVPLIEGIDVVLPIVVGELVVGFHFVVDAIVGSGKAGHVIGYGRADPITVILETNGLLLGDGPVGARTPIEAVGGVVLVVECRGRKIGVAIVVGGGIGFLPAPLTVGIADFSVIGETALAERYVEIVLVADVAINANARVFYNGKALKVFLVVMSSTQPTSLPYSAPGWWMTFTSLICVTGRFSTTL